MNEQPDQATGDRQPSSALVTGGTGFIAPRLMGALLDRGWQVRTCGRRPRPETLPEDVDYRRADLTGDESLEPLFDGVTHLFHLAGASSSQSTDEQMYRTNVEGTDNLLGAAYAAGVKRVLHMSTSSIYGKEVDLPQPVPEDVEPHPSPGYAESKWQGEQVAWGFADKGLAVTVVRPVTVYGPGAIKLLASSILDAAIERFAGMEAFAVQATPVEVRMVHVDDVVAACIHLVEHEAAGGRAYNIAPGFYPTNHDVGEVIARELGLRSQLSDDPDRGMSYEDRAQVRERMLAEGMKDNILLKEKRIRFLKKANPNNRLSIQALLDTGFRPQVTDLAGSVAALIRWYQDERWIL
ncbi:MAG: NAD(P)-dependent oxidoreductase [Actinomycetota bacterium]|nr:NAD(P)-dependent oxidoreductase [Actinomycetota bacterium]